MFDEIEMIQKEINYMACCSYSFVSVKKQQVCLVISQYDQTSD